MPGCEQQISLKSGTEGSEAGFFFLLIFAMILHDSTFHSTFHHSLKSKKR